MPELKIARVETFLFDPGAGKNVLFCRMETEDGLHGWGEAYVTPGKEPVIQQCLQAMATHVIGRSALNIRHTAQIMFEDFAIRRASLDLLSAWSALEIAMWDIVAKRATTSGQPSARSASGDGSLSHSPCRTRPWRSSARTVSSYCFR